MNHEQNKNWMVVYTKPRSEKKVAERLNRLGLSAYCPTYTVLQQWSDRKKKVELPLIPSYVFVHVHEAERTLVLQDASVMNFVYWLGKPAIVQQDEIFQLGKFSESTKNMEYSIGGKIEIQTGNFKGQEGEIYQLSKTKITVLLKTLGLKIILPIEKN